jgi:hypothetical protein
MFDQVPELNFNQNLRMSETVNEETSGTALNSTPVFKRYVSIAMN